MDERALIKLLREALYKYGQHGQLCPVAPYKDPKDSDKCDCGLSEALGAADSADAL